MKPTISHSPGWITINIKPYQQDVSSPITGEEMLEYKSVISCSKSPLQQSANIHCLIKSNWILHYPFCYLAEE